MRHSYSLVVAVAALIGCPIVAAVAHDYTPSPSPIRFDSRQSTGGTHRDGGDRVVLTGVVVRVNEETGRIALRSDSHRRYNVDTINAEVVTPDVGSSKSADDLAEGARVCVVGSRYGVGLIEADYVTVLPSHASGPSVYVFESDTTSPVESQPAPAVAASVHPKAPGGQAKAHPSRVASNPLPSVPPLIASTPFSTSAPPPTSSGSTSTVRIEAVVNSVMPDSGQLTATGADDQVYRVKAGDADIILPRIARAGSLDDLHQGMRVRLIGERTEGSIILADRIRVLSTDEPATAARPSISELGSFTGVLIDTRAFQRIQRSPSPAIYGPGLRLIYPDRSHVPTPDEVQDESIVRYYRSEDAAAAGVGGSHPLILDAETVVGPAEDGVMLSAEDAALFRALDQRLQYSRNWKVGFLVPADR